MSKVIDNSAAVSRCLSLPEWFVAALQRSVLLEQQENSPVSALVFGLAKLLSEQDKLPPAVIVALLREMLPFLLGLATTLAGLQDGEQADESVAGCHLVIHDWRWALWSADTGLPPHVFDLETVSLVEHAEFQSLWLHSSAYNLPGVFKHCRAHWRSCPK